MEIEKFEEIEVEQRNIALYEAVSGGSIVDIAKLLYASFTGRRDSDEIHQEIYL